MRPVIKLPSRTVDLNEGVNQLRHLLLEAVGSYCMYCESPVTMDFPVSHRVSVSDVSNDFTFDTLKFVYTIGVGRSRFSKAWVNQQVACAACVAAQGESPGSQEGFDRMRTVAPTRFQELTSGARGRRIRLNDDAQDDLYINALGSWVWPDVSSDENGLIVLPGDDTWNLLTFQTSSKTQVELAEQGLLRLRASERTAAWAGQQQQKVWVIPNETWIGQQPNSQDLMVRVKRTIAGWNLNYYNPTQPLANDRRVDNRTLSLTVVDAALTSLTQLVNQSAAQSRGDEDLEQLRVMELAGIIRETLRSTGFWSLWVWRFLGAIQNPTAPPWNRYSATARRLLIYQLFAEYEIDNRTLAQPLPTKPASRAGNEDEEDIDSQMVLPGTDLGRLPF